MKSVPSVPVAQYLRMSTEHQQYSLENQTAAITRYASEHGFVVTHTYKDAGKSVGGDFKMWTRPRITNLSADQRVSRCITVPSRSQMMAP
jgi:DNA invertase Pin-like site-specific DNA recombinase